MSFLILFDHYLMYSLNGTLNSVIKHRKKNQIFVLLFVPVSFTFSPLRPLSSLLCQAGSPFREPLIKFLTRHPSQTVELFMMEATLNDPQWSRMFMVSSSPLGLSLTHLPIKKALCCLRNGL